jgi:hypothetical protein
VMQVRVVHVDLPESGNFVLHARSAEQAETALVLDIFFKPIPCPEVDRRRRRVRRRRRSRL